MIRRMISLATVAIFAGSVFFSTSWFETTEQRLIGLWHMSIEMTETDLRQMSPTENPVAAAFAQMLMKSVQAEVTVNFRSDHSATLNLSFLGNAYERSAIWQVAETNGQTAHVNLIFVEGSEPTRWTITFQNKDAFQAPPPIDSTWAATKTVTFRRVKPAGA